MKPQATHIVVSCKMINSNGRVVALHAICCWFKSNIIRINAKSLLMLSESGLILEWQHNPDNKVPARYELFIQNYSVDRNP